VSAGILICFEEYWSIVYVCVNTGELKVNDVKRAWKNSETKRENASSREFVFRREEQSASLEKVIKRTRRQRLNDSPPNRVRRINSAVDKRLKLIHRQDRNLFSA